MFRLCLLLLLASSAYAQLVPQIVQQHQLDNRTKALFQRTISAQIDAYFQTELNTDTRADRVNDPQPTLEVTLKQEGVRWTLQARAWLTQPPTGYFFIAGAECKTKGAVIDFIERDFPTAVLEIKKMLAAVN